MAAIPVTTAEQYTIRQGARVNVRLSNGRVYVVVEDTANDQITVWKANATTPASFSEPDTGNGPSGTVWGSCSAAVDSSDVIHIAYMTDEGKASQLRYVKFASDVFTGDEQVIADIGEDPGSLGVLQTAIAIDSNDKPHIAFITNAKVGGTAYLTVDYINDVDNNWNGGVSYEVEGGVNSKRCQYPDISIDADNKPVISYSNETDNDVGTAIGNQNDAESFTLQDIDTDHETTSGANLISICVDSSGNHYVAYRDEGDTFIYIRKHTYGVGWGTWVARSTGSDEGSCPSIVADGTDIYVFYYNSDADIVYEKVTGGSSWGGDVTLETGTYDEIKAKFGFWVDNDSGGALVDKTNEVTYYFDGSDVSVIDAQGVWTNEDPNSQDGSILTYAYTATTYDGVTNTLYIEGTTCPGTNLGPIVKVEARVYAENVNGSGGYTDSVFASIRVDGGGKGLGIIENISVPAAWTSFLTLTVPTGGWSWSGVAALEARIYGELDGTSTQARFYKVEIKVTYATRSAASELDYVFTDSTNDILFNSLALVSLTTPAPTTVGPTTIAPTTLPPTTLGPTTIAPTTVAPTTIAPTTLPPTTVAPTTLPPTTPAPTTIAPTTLAPTTIAPTTLGPTTLKPTTIPPTTLVPTTSPPTTTGPTTTGPTTPTPTTLPPTTLAPTTIGPTTIAPTTPTPTTIAPTTIAPTTLAPTTPTPTTVAPTTLVPTTLPPTTLAPTTVTPTTLLPTTIAPTTLAPTTQAPTTVAPTTLAPTTSAPTTPSPTTIAPTTIAPTTVAPTTQAPTTSAPTTAASTTITPTTTGPTTVAPTTLAPTTLPPTTLAPTTIAPTTPVPTTIPPTTIAPTTIPPTTLAPTTLPPTTLTPTTVAPTTIAPTTIPPTTLPPTTLGPTTVPPTTIAPTTPIPTTPSPTTLVPTTIAPTTLVPTTSAPTTIGPTTLKPTTVPPTTFVPTTPSPTTVGPTTIAPTTVKPTTSVPTTSAPTTIGPTTIGPSTPIPTTLPPTTLGPTTPPPEVFECIREINSLIAELIIILSLVNEQINLISTISEEVNLRGDICW